MPFLSFGLALLKIEIYVLWKNALELSRLEAGTRLPHQQSR